ncbi:MAG: hypothetical protein LBD74_04240 [Spirochaetaceae bacterium]|jgi:hypothetical protein|nr:hypothetical protein [Spirochaetaceae bacterium]
MHTHKVLFLGLSLWGSFAMGGFFAWAEASRPPALDSSAGVFLVSHSATEGALELEQDYTAYAQEALEKALSGFAIANRKTFSVSSALTLETIATHCRAEGVRWGVIVMTTLKGYRFSWHFAVYDEEEHRFRSYDYFFIPLGSGGFSSPVIDRSAQGVAQNWHNSLSSRDFDGRLAVTQGQRFTGVQEGVRVLFGSLDHFLEGGILAEGEFTSAFNPFTEGLPLYGVLVKDRYWPRSLTLPQGVTPETVRLPLLQRKTRHSIAMGYEFRGDIFACLDVEYRFHLLPDRLFLKAEWGIYNDTSQLSDGEKALHQEYRVGAGVYVQPRPDGGLRFYAGTGLSLLTASGSLITLADPLWVGAEYHFPHWALKAEFRLPELLGYQRDSFEADTSGFRSYGLVGILLKW